MVFQGKKLNISLLLNRVQLSESMEYIPAALLADGFAVWGLVKEVSRKFSEANGLEFLSIKIAYPYQNVRGKGSYLTAFLWGCPECWPPIGEGDSLILFGAVNAKTFMGQQSIEMRHVIAILVLSSQEGDCQGAAQGYWWIEHPLKPNPVSKENQDIISSHKHYYRGGSK